LKFLVMWDHPAAKSAVEEIRADMLTGKIKESGRIVGTTRGYAVEVKDEAKLFKLTEKYRSRCDVKFSTVESVLSLEDLLKAPSA
jgi:hypothetical protein